MKKQKIGYIKVSRYFLEHPLYSGSDAFSLKDVYLDLNIRAYHKEKTKMYKNKLRTYQRGQVEGSIRQFAEWWHMGVNTARRRLEELQRHGLIYVESTNVNTVVTLRNYCIEQDSEGLGWNTDGYTDGYANEYTGGYADGYTDEHNLKNDKECIKNDIKNEKKEPSADFGFVKDGVTYE